MAKQETAEPTTTAQTSDTDLFTSAFETVAAAIPDGPQTGIDAKSAAAIAGQVFATMLRQPGAVAGRSARMAAEGIKIAAGTSKVEPGSRDRRFADETWQSNAAYRRLSQAYLTWATETHGLVADLDLDPKTERGAEFLTTLVTDAAAPTNHLLGNPAALRHARDTKGRSLVEGMKNLVGDVRHNGGMPSSVDTQPFTPGETIAATPGSVVFQNPVLELIQYTPTTDKVYKRPLMIVPPQINKYYIMDLAPGRSFVEHAVSNGHQVFAVSWRNPGPEHRDWNLDTYADAILEATDAALEITRSKDLNVLGVCAGGMTMAATMGHLAAKNDKRIRSATFLVTVIDWDQPTTMGSIISSPVAAASTQKSQSEGVLSGADLSSIFSWLRPNDLVWNYWVNNYLMGKKPAAFDVLAWNADSTNLPAALHGDLMEIAGGNTLTKADEVVVLGTPVDLGAVSCPSFVVGAVTDHITPWQGCYETINLLGGEDRTFVLSSQGHIQALVNPSGNPKGKFHINDATPTDAQEWLDGAEEHAGSWWDHWTVWAKAHGGRKVNAPSTSGSEAHPAGIPAPGSYVLN